MPGGSSIAYTNASGACVASLPPLPPRCTFFVCVQLFTFFLCVCVFFCLPVACLLCAPPLPGENPLDGKAGEKVLLEDGAGEDVMFMVRGRASITRRGVEVSDVYIVVLSVPLQKTIPH